MLSSDPASMIQPLLAVVLMMCSSWLSALLSCCCGLMTVAPLHASERELHAVFAGLRTLRDQLVARTGMALPELSMGMSGDMDIAVAEGATIVRIGTAIFGRR